MNWDKFKIQLQYATPKHLLSRLVGKFAAARAGWFTQLFIRWFIKQYRIDMSEAVYENPRDYSTFNEFFTRYLKPELRPLEAVADDQFAHPVDGSVSQLGDIEDGR
ncbi:phosphatidylserine decarboxylase, partial [Pseudidiomarina aestuarii]